jgi:hypothetical protein
MTSHERSATRKHSMDGLPCGQLHEMLKCEPCPRNGQSSRPSMAYSLTRARKTWMPATSGGMMAKRQFHVIGMSGDRPLSVRWS